MLEILTLVRNIGPSFSMDVFNQVFTLNMAHEIWLKLQELHDGTSNVREKKTLSSKAKL